MAQCSISRCQRQITHRIDVQWSVFDFTEDHCCEQHIQAKYDYWIRQLVDGDAPWITAIRLDPEST